MPITEDSLRLGKMVRDLRKAKGLTLQQVAEDVGRSVGYLSQVERGASDVSIPTLQSISDLLGVQLTWFFHADKKQPIEELGLVVRGENRRRLDYFGSGITEELLSPSLAGELLMLLTTFAPEAETDVKQRKRRGEEAAYINSGQLEIKIDDKEFRLQAGDSFSLAKQQSFYARNPSSITPAEIIWVITPPNY